MPTTAWEQYIEKGLAQTREARGLAYVPAALPPKSIPEIPDERASRLHLLDSIREVEAEALQVLGRLSGLAEDISITRVLAAPLVRSEASLSSKIEDTIASPKAVALFESGQKPRSNDAIEVSNYRRALEHGLRSPLPLSKRLINEMHAILLEGVRGEQARPGRIRTTQNRIGGRLDDFSTARFVPPPPGETLERCLHDLELVWNYGIKKWSPLATLALAHYQFEAIHPFDDGNGRIGRLLIILTLVKQGYIPEPLVYVSGYFERHRSQYYDHLLAVSTEGAWEAWLRFFVTGLAVQARASAEKLSQIKSRRRDAIERLAKAKENARTIVLVDHFIEHLALDARSVSELLNVADPTARKDIAALERIGFVQELTGSKYGQVWGPQPILDLIDEP
ncbi:MAG: Fic/DOC family N-terminal domain-containing protein [Planctomycetota bacterium]